MREGPGYALIDEDGIVFYVADTYDEALSEAARVMPRADVWYEGPPPWEDDTEEPAAMAANGDVVPLPLRKKRKTDEEREQDILLTPERALRLSTVRHIDESEVMSMSLEEAHAAIKGFFPTKHIGADGGVAPRNTYSTPQSMVRNFLGKNAKIEKAPREGLPLSFSIGLNMLPANNWQRPDVQEIVRLAKAKYGVQSIELPSLTRAGSDIATFCASATKQCQNSCLVFSGQNLNDRWNTIKKLALTMSFANEPVAFLRILVEAIRKWEHECECEGAVCFVRLNVYSDIPWELVCPWLFSMFPKIRFYDYTKVAGRMPMRGGQYPIENYDLTFSYSGTKKNLDEIDYEVGKNRRRIAVTFATIGKTKNILGGKVTVPRKPPEPEGEPYEWSQMPYVGLPSKFMGLYVIDGDQSDFRPYDPPYDTETDGYDLPPVVVGLRWKVPSKQNVSATAARLFIVPGYLVNDKETGAKTTFVVMELPRYTEVFGKGEPPPWKDISLS